MKNDHLSVFVDYLNQLSLFLKKIESLQQEGEAILEARLAEDMFPLYTQAVIAANFSLRAACPIAKVEVVSFEQPSKTFSALEIQLQKTIAFLIELDAKTYDLSSGIITDMAGPTKVNLPTQKYLNSFALPNFFFHLSMVYAIVRVKGKSVTKGDFDGFHQYPDGFSF